MGLCVVALSINLKLTTTLDRAITQNPCYVPLNFQTMLLKIKDLKNGKIYSNDMSNQNTQSILSMNFCTSYTEVEVQDEIDNDGKRSFPTHTVILPPYGVSLKDINWVDLIAIQEDARGEWLSD